MKIHKICLFSLACILICLQTNATENDKKGIQADIECFCSQYLELVGTEESDYLLHNIFTPEMYEKYGRLICETGGDPLLGGQDFVNSQKYECKHLEESWYEICWHDTIHNNRRSIPIKCITDTLGITRISYIVPEWGKYGDTFLSIIPHDIIYSNGEKFLTTFYSNYVLPYISMSLKLKIKLEDIRAKYCTSDFLSKYPITEDEGCTIDPIIANKSDIDFWSYNALEINNCGKGWFLLDFRLDKRKIKIKLKRKKGEYKITDLLFL